MSLPFIDLHAQQRRIGGRIDAALAEVLEHGQYVNGPEVAALEERLAAFAEADHAVSCANGTDALALVLMAWRLRPGEAVFCPSFSFAATAEVVPWFGAVPVFVDVDPETYTLDPEKLADAIEATKSAGELRPRAIIAVDLFGQPAGYPAIAEIARAHGLKLIADSAQGFGCTLHGRHPGAWADATTTSFFPAKPLGCYGDGGAVLTRDDDLAALLRSLRNHGAGTERYDNVRIGTNSRLDTMQAAILLEKLDIFADEIAERDVVAARYSRGLAPLVAATPTVIEGGTSTWAQYTIEHDARDALRAHLADADIPTAVHYARPIHQQTAYARYPHGPGGLAVTERLADRVISLPMHPYLAADDQDRIIETVAAFADVAAPVAASAG